MTTDKVEPLSAEEEAEWRKVAADNEFVRADGVRRLFATLDTARAKAAALEDSADKWCEQAIRELGARERAEAKLSAAEQESERLREESKRLSGGLIAISGAAETVPAQVLRGIAYDVALNCIKPDVAEYQIERRATLQQKEERPPREEADLFWPEADHEQPCSPEEYADQSGEKALTFEMQRARSLPNRWYAAQWRDYGWQITEHETMEEAEAALSPAQQKEEPDAKQG